MTLPDDSSHRLPALPSLQEALEILREQLRLPDWPEDARAMPTFDARTPSSEN